MPWIPALIGAVGGLAVGALGDNAATSAANTQAGAANHATDVQQQMFNQVRQSLAPYMATGQIGLNEINALLKDPSMVTKLPGYQFQMDQGTAAIDNSASSQGLTGNTLKSLTQFGQGLGSSYYNNFWNQAMGLADLGQNSAAGVGQMSGQVGQSIGNNIIGAGNAIAAGQVGSAQALAGGVNGGIQNWLLAQSLQSGGGGGGYGAWTGGSLAGGGIGGAGMGG